MLQFIVHMYLFLNNCSVFYTFKFPNKEFLLRVSYMEIYNETVTDLLVDSRKRKPLEVREAINVSEVLDICCLDCGKYSFWVL